jgi:hypothetical protein
MSSLAVEVYNHDKFIFTLCDVLTSEHLLLEAPRTVELVISPFVQLPLARLTWSLKLPTPPVSYTNTFFQSPRAR